MRKQITFKNKAELAKWLIDNEGKKLYTNIDSDNYLIFNENSANSPFKFFDKTIERLDVMDGVWEIACLYIEVDWRETLSEENPKLCRVWDFGKQSANIRIIEKYTPKGNYRYKDTYGCGWKHAEPLSVEEASKFGV